MLLLTTGELKCFIGVALGSHAQEITGAIMACSGMCSNVTLAIHNTVATIFTCDPFDVCQTIEIDNECNLQLPDISMCCCSNKNFCNVKNWIMRKAVSQSPNAFTESPIPSDMPPQKTIECYVGIDFYERIQIGSHFNLNKLLIQFKEYIIMRLFKYDHTRNLQNFYLSIKSIIPLIQNLTKKYNIYQNLINNNTISPLNKLYNGQGLVIKMNCTGSCANTTLGGAGMIYFCDPEYFCLTHNLENRCNNMNSLLKSCCCSEEFCNMDYNDIVTNISTKSTLHSYETTTSLSNLENNNKINLLTMILFLIFSIFLK